MKLYTPVTRACYFGDSDLMSNLVPITVAYDDGIGLEQTMIDNRGVNGEVGYTLSQGQ